MIRRCNDKLLQEDLTSKVISQHLWELFATNENSVTDPFMLWNANKTFIRGIQQGARVKKTLQRKTHSSVVRDPHFRNEQYDKHLKRLKLNFYAGANKAGNTK